MDPMQFYIEEIARCRQVQTEMEALLETMNNQYTNKVLPYITEFPDKRVIAQKLYDQASFLTDLMRENLQQIHYMEEQINHFREFLNPRWHHEDDDGYASGDDDVSGDNDIPMNEEHESSGYETECALEIDLGNI
ncbi:unnamed protein product [Hermetia illucens]|uniref:Uncharacterized protein n=1 Tax=Hermetia illucens TaxID=343691 RepID=A0A7R8UBU7_HERIL|nr:unnamed protein product [Hermetia illucens]